MKALIGSISQEQWEACLADFRKVWGQLVEQTSSLRASEEGSLRHVLSGAGISPEKADRLVALYFEGLGTKGGPESLAGFICHHDPDELPPPSVESVSELAALMEAEWQVMFKRLTKAFASPRTPALAEARKAPAQPPKSLEDAFLSPVDDIARMHSPEEARPIVSIALGADAQEDGEPEESAGVGKNISRTIQQNLRLQREIAKFSLFWTDAPPERAAFVTLNAPQPARRVRRSFWRPSTWFDHSECPPSAAEWREPVPSHVPTKAELGVHLRDWRARTEKEAEELRAAEAEWTRSVTDLGKELEARRETERRHQPVNLDSESACQVKLEEAKALTTRADKNLQTAGEEMKWIT